MVSPKLPIFLLFDFALILGLFTFLGSDNLALIAIFAL